MMRSMFSGVSGLRTHQTKMDVIANNISNVNTVGFKSSRVTFNDVFSQTVSGASRANEETGRGGTNPMQIGLGVNVASIDKNMGTGAAQRTDRALDVMINGDGFFIVGDNSGTYFTRAGAFSLDEQGFIAMPNGMKVYGWDTKVEADGTISIQKDKAMPIQITGDKEFATPKTTKNIALEGNLNTIDSIDPTSTATPPVNKPITRSISFFDSTGNRYTTDIELTYTGPIGTTGSRWTGKAALEGTPGKAYMYLNGDKNNKVEIDPAGLAFNFEFDTKGNLVGATSAATTTAAKSIQLTVALASGATLNPPATFGDGSGNITIDFSNLKQYGSSTTNAKFASKDGNAYGTLEGLSVGSDGIITGRYSNGDTKMIGQIPIAKFKNPAGLEGVGSNLFVPTSNSGEFDGIGVETGDIMGGVLEMSNVDLSSEFTEMITTQRGFQASSRLITTSDEMLQELVNLKR